MRETRAEARRARPGGAFDEEFRGREEPDIYEVLECARPYLPREGAFGEMVLNVGKVVYLAKKGAAGIIDISPFTCMNGIVCEAIYPRISRDLGGLPIRNFYFDGTQSDLDRDLGVYMELATQLLGGSAELTASMQTSRRSTAFLKSLSKALRASSALRGAGGPRIRRRRRAAPTFRRRAVARDRDPRGEQACIRWPYPSPECAPESASGTETAWTARNASTACSSAVRHCISDRCR